MMHIGRHIRAALRDKKLTVTEFAERLNCTRPNAYKIFAKRTIDIELLWRISQVLKHNFFADLSRDYRKENPTHQQPDNELPT